MTSSSDFSQNANLQLPLRVVGARRGVGSFLNIDMKGIGTPSSSWMFWVYLCDWSLTENGVEVLTSKNEDDREYEIALAKLILAELVTVVGLDDNETCKLEFSNGLELFLDDAADLYGENQDLVMIFRDGSIFCVFCAGKGLIPSNER